MLKFRAEDIGQPSFVINNPANGKKVAFLSTAHEANGFN
jgi:hypothetical protein